MDLPGNVITTIEQLEELVDYYSSRPAFAFDIETRGEHKQTPLLADVRWIALATEGRCDVIPMGHHGDLDSKRLAPNKKGEQRMARGVAYEDLNPKYDLSKRWEYTWLPAPEQLERHDVMPYLAVLFHDDEILKIAHNEKFDIHGLSQFIGRVEPPYFDTMIASWLFDSQRVKRPRLRKDRKPSVAEYGKTAHEVVQNGLSLQDCVWRELGEYLEKGVGEDIDIHGFTEVALYALRDADSTFRLYQVLDEALSKEPALDRLMQMEMAVMLPSLDMESHGVQTDQPRLDSIRVEFERRQEELEGLAYRHAGREFNLRSNRQKQEILFTPKSEGGQGLSVRNAKPTPTGAKKHPDTRTIYDYSVDHAFLEAHVGNRLCATLIEHAAIGKLLGTYVQPYLGENSRTRNGGRIYGQFKQSGTESGRFSSANPNLQNIPSRSTEGRRIRECFIPDKGGVLLAADYSQIEPRIIASLSNDPTMIETYRSGGDVYQAVGDRMGVDRQWGKTLVLAIAYGVGAGKISADIGCSMTEARELMDDFGHQFPRIGQHKRKVINHARRLGYASTIFGRIRYLPDLKSGDDELRSKAYRQAYNHRIQGTAADIMKLALVNVHAALPTYAHMIMTVHDEIVITLPDELTKVDTVSRIVSKEMESAAPPQITVPLVAEVKTGYKWSDCK